MECFAALEQGMRTPCRDAYAPGVREGWRAEKRKILMARALRHAGAFRRANHGVFRQRPLLSSGPSRSNTPTDPSASSWPGLLVAPEGAPTPPECLVATRPAGAAPSSRFTTPHDRAPQWTRWGHHKRSSEGGSYAGITAPCTRHPGFRRYDGVSPSPRRSATNRKPAASSSSPRPRRCAGARRRRKD